VDRQPDSRHRKILTILRAAACVAVLAVLAAAPPRTVFVQESFDQPNLSGRGWYDSVRPLLSTEHVGPAGSSVEYRFAAGATKPTTGSPLRRKFGPSDSVYFSCFVKYSANWVGSLKPYHPHEFHVLTSIDDDWAGLSFTHLTVYVEENGGTPLVAIQDGRNVDQQRVGKDLTSATEHRAAAGCNGSSDGYPDNCYMAAEGHVNEKKWKAPAKLFGDTNWHFVEAFVRLNSIAGGKGVRDGVVQYWLDRRLVIDHHDVLLRTAANPSMRFNQFVIAPYIGDGSPVAQSMWIDELTVASARQ
jgi:hypothetical protein